MQFFFNKDLIKKINFKYIYINVKIDSNLRIEITKIKVNIKKIFAKEKN